MSHPYKYRIEMVDKSLIAPGDIIEASDGLHHTVSRSDIKYDPFMGKTIRGDSYCLGYKKVARVVIEVFASWTT